MNAGRHAWRFYVDLDGTIWAEVGLEQWLGQEGLWTVAFPVPAARIGRFVAAPGVVAPSENWFEPGRV